MYLSQNRGRSNSFFARLLQAIVTVGEGKGRHFWSDRSQKALFEGHGSGFSGAESRCGCPAGSPRRMITSHHARRLANLALEAHQRVKSPQTRSVDTTKRARACIPIKRVGERTALAEESLTSHNRMTQHHIPRVDQFDITSTLPFQKPPHRGQ